MIRAFALVGVLLIVHFPLQAQDLPSGWPWRGISVGFPEGKPSDVARYKKELGINMVRLQIKSRKFAKDNRISGVEAFNEGMRWADEMLDECARLGIIAILNISQFPLNPEAADQTTDEFWLSEDSKKEVVNVAKHLAKHFRSRGTELVGYDIMSEPVIVEGKKNKSPKEWPGLLKQIIEVVGSLDAQRWLVVAPGPWGGPVGYKDFSPPGSGRLIWGVHVYMPHGFTHQGIREFESGIKYPGRVGFRYWDKDALENTLFPLRQFQLKYGGVVWVGEFSAVRWANGGEQYIRDLASIFDEYGWGWAYFSGTGWHGWNPDYNQNYPGKDRDGAWKKDFVGDESERWKTLRTIFGAAGKKVIQ